MTDVAKMAVVCIRTACRIIILDFWKERVAAIFGESEFASPEFYVHGSVHYSFILINVQ